MNQQAKQLQALNNLNTLVQQYKFQSGIGLDYLDHFQNLQLAKMTVQNMYANDVKKFSICDQAIQETLKFMKLNGQQEFNEECMETFPTWNEESANLAIEISQQIEAQQKVDELELKLMKEAN